MGKKYISQVIGDDYKTWKKNKIYFIDAQTGAGKTYFIKDRLGKYAKAFNCKMLILTNRDSLKEQISNDIGKSMYIDLMNYQQLESLYKYKKINLDEYTYIISDECQYFVNDIFNVNTDLSLETIMNTRAVKVFMTGTPYLIKYLFKQMNYEIEKEYITKRDYSYLSNIINYSTDGQLRYILDTIPKDEQAIIFTSANRGHDLAKEYDGSFICSKYNTDFNTIKTITKIETDDNGKETKTIEKDIQSSWDTDELDLIIKEQRFQKQFLFCTTCLDNGVNLKENSNVKHIIIDKIGVSLDTFMQCLGRRRVADDETVNLYFYDYAKDGKSLNGVKKKYNNTLEVAECLDNEGQKSYIEKYFKQYTFDQRIINVRNDENGNAVYTVNKSLYWGIKGRELTLSCMLDKEDKQGNEIEPITYRQLIAINLKINKDKIKYCEGSVELLNLEGQLEMLIGQYLYKEEQKELAELFNIKRDGHLLKSISTLNAYLDEVKMPYIIKSKRQTYRDENDKIKKKPTSWVIYKLVS